MTDPTASPNEPIRSTEPVRTEPASTGSASTGSAYTDPAYTAPATAGEPHRSPAHVAPEPEQPTVAAPVDKRESEASKAVRHDVLAREKEEFGGFKFGSAFFGWLTATGTAVILTAIVAGAGTAVGLGTSGSADAAAEDAQNNASTIGIVGAIAVGVILFVAYFCGGYVAGRMARFSGGKQGVAVWLWAVAIAIIVGVVGALAGSQFNILANLNSFPRLPINEGDLTVFGIATAVGAIVVSLIAAVIGGLAGMRYHREVDRVGLAEVR